MKKQISFPSIEQFRNVVSGINRHYSFKGLDTDGNAIYDNTLAKPVLTFKGSIKLHGTNAGVWAQSRENIITPVKDNAGFAFFVENNEEVFKSLILQVVNREDLDISKNTVTIYGEWAGKGIQKSVGISNIEKSLFIFGVKISPFPDAEDIPVSYWVDHSYLSTVNNRIYNIEDFKTHSIDIDFNMPQLVQNKLSELTIEVENECPVAKEFGFSGTGEGIVWSCELNGVVYRFKVKGEKHSVTRVKTLAAVGVEKLNSIKDFVEYAVTGNRFSQAIENVFGKDEVDVKKLGDCIRWIVADITKEESDTLFKNGLEPKEVNKYISQKVREMFFEKLKVVDGL